ncbi:MAG: phosphorylase [Rhizobiales bacterium]|nr:phosphorylase [Hyphomicrobiales bacterium]
MFAWAAQSVPILAVTGLAAEARLATGPGVTTILAGGNPARLRSLLQSRVKPDCRAVISIGIAGGLDPILVPGDVIVATGVAAPDRWHTASPSIARRIAARLSNHPKRVIMADIAGADSAVLLPSDKRSLRSATGALTVDMESHVAAAFAAQHGLPFAAVRVVCDPAHRALPDLIATALRPDGEVSFGNVFSSLWERPIQLLALPRLARDAAEGFRALRRCRELLGHSFGMLDCSEWVGEAEVCDLTTYRPPAPVAASHVTASAKAS